MTNPGPTGRSARRRPRSSRLPRGFTLIELMVVVVVLGVLVAIAMPNFISSSNRAKEASVKANMHALQFVAEDFLIKGDSTYAGSAADLAPQLMPDFDNQFDQTVGAGNAWEDRASYSGNPSPKPGISSYADSLGMSYNIKAYGAKSTMTLILSSGTR